MSNMDKEIQQMKKMKASPGDLLESYMAKIPEPFHDLIPEDLSTEGKAAWIEANSFFSIEPYFRLLGVAPGSNPYSGPGTAPGTGPGTELMDMSKVIVPESLIEIVKAPPVAESPAEVELWDEVMEEVSKSDESMVKKTADYGEADIK
jgi:hypothetical protein